jgi:hypothetical protein
MNYKQNKLLQFFAPISFFGQLISLPDVMLDVLVKIAAGILFTNQPCSTEVFSQCIQL